MAATFLELRYGVRPDATSRRPSVLALQAGLWLLAGPPRRVQRERLHRAAIREGSFEKPLGSDPVTLELPLLLRPSEGPSGTTFQGELNRLRSLRGQPLHLYLGGEDWEDEWLLERLSESYETWNLPADESATETGGIAVSQARVTLHLERPVPSGTTPTVTL